MSKRVFLSDLVAPIHQSTVSTGTAPLIVASNTVVTNLNADLLDGLHSSAFQSSGISFPSPATLATDIGTEYTWYNAANLTYNSAGIYTFYGYQTSLSFMVDVGYQTGTLTLISSALSVNQGWSPVVGARIIANASNAVILQIGVYTNAITNWSSVSAIASTRATTFFSTLAVESTSITVRSQIILYGTLKNNTVGTDFLKLTGGTLTGTLNSTVATGTAPLTVNSTTLVTNLNTDLLDNQHGAYYLDWNNFTNKPSLTGFVDTTTNQTVAGIKTWSDTSYQLFNGSLNLKANASSSFATGYGGFGFINNYSMHWNVSNGTTSKFNIFDFAATTAMRTYAFPDKSGTFAMISDVPSAAGFVDTTTGQTIGGTKTFTLAPLVTTIGTANGNVATYGQLMNAPNLIEFQRQFRSVPRILVNTSAPGMCREFLQIVPANNYCHAKISVINFGSTVKNFSFMTGYDALSETTWSELTAEEVLNDRGEDFKIEIKKVTGFGPTNFGILLRYHNTNSAGGSQASIKVDFALELPAVGPNYDQFVVLSSAEYAFSGSTTLYGRKLTLNANGDNWTDNTGASFLKSTTAYVAPSATYFIGTTSNAFNRASGAQTLTGVSIDGSAATVTTAAQPNITSVGTLTSLTSSGTITGAKVLIGSGAFLTNSYFRVGQSVNAHIQANIQNTNTGTLASSDWVATANTGSDTTNFINMGINGSANADPAWTMAGALDGYLFTNGGNLVIGTQSAKDVKFFTGGVMAANEKMRLVNATGNLLIGTTTDSTFKVDVVGAGRFSTTLTVTGAITSSADATINQIRVGVGAIATTGSAALGYQALNVVSNVNAYAVAIGFSALKALTTGANDVAIGYGSQFTNQTSGNNTSVGWMTLNAFNIAGVGNNAVFGYAAARYLTTGINNTLIGSQTGNNAAFLTISGMVALGFQAGMNETTDNKLYIANSSTATPLIWGDFSLSQLKVNGSLTVTNLGGSGAQMVVVDNNGLMSKQAIPSGGGTTLNGTGLVRMAGAAVSYDNTTYAPLASPSLTGVVGFSAGTSWTSSGWQRLATFSAGAIAFDGTTKHGIGNSGGSLYFWNVADYGTTLGPNYWLTVSPTGQPTFNGTLTTGAFVSNGNATISGALTVGANFKAGTSVLEGYYQDTSNGAYRALNGAVNGGFYFQDYNGVNTRLYVGLTGTYAGRIGVGTLTPGFTLDVAGTGNFTGNVTLTGNNRMIFGPNSSYSRYLSIGGVTGYNATTASIAVTDGNLHLDAATGTSAMYLNYYSGTGGVIFGNGAGLTSGASVNSSGNMFANSFNGQLNGSATSTLCIDNVASRSADGAYLYPNANPTRVRFDFVGAGTIGAGGNYAGVMTFSPYVGTTGSTGDASYQLGFGSTSPNGGGVPKLRLRKGIDTTWNGWYNIYSDADTEVLSKRGGSYYAADTWISFGGGTGYGLYFPGSTAGTHFQPNPTSSYGAFMLTGSKGAYGGIYDSYSGVAWMHDSGGNGGFYRQSSSTWQIYWSETNGSLGIGTSTTSGSYRAYVNGSLYATGDVVAYSDARKKENVVTIEGALNKILNLRGVNYNMIGGDGSLKMGVIAQETYKIIPEVVTYDKDNDQFGVSYGNMAGLFIEAIKEQKSEHDLLKEEVAKLKQEVIRLGGNL